MGHLKFRKIVIFFLMPALFLYIVFFVFPFLKTLIFSFSNWDGFKTSDFIGLANYTDILKDEIFKSSMARVLIWVVMALIFKVGLALVIAFVLRKKMRGIKFFRTVIFIPYILSSAAMCLMFTIMYDKEIGFFNIVLRSIGLDSITRYWTADPKTAFGAVIAIPIYQAIGYFFVILFAATQDISEELYEAGRMDGTNALQEFFYITIPGVWKTFVVCITLSINGTFQNYGYIFILTYGGPNHVSEVPATLMYKSLFVNSEYGYGGAIAMLIFLCVLALTVFVQKVIEPIFNEG